jgi:outer membrane protein OmpA-like peptidoglycan-associated protein
MKYLKRFNEEFSPEVNNLYYKFAIPHKVCGKGFIFDPETNSCVDVTTFDSLSQFCDKFGIDDFQPYQAQKPLINHLMNQLVDIIYRCKPQFVKAYSTSVNSRFKSDIPKIEEVISLIEREVKYGDIKRALPSIQYWFVSIPQLLSSTNKQIWLDSTDGRKWGTDLGKFELLLELLLAMGLGLNDEQTQKIQRKLDLLSSKIFFYGGQTKIREYSEGEINSIVDMLQLYPIVNVEILGWHNTSNPSLVGSESIDIARAKSIRDLLISKGIEAKRIKSTGMGESKIVPTDEYGKDKGGNKWNKNMRVEIKIVKY